MGGEERIALVTGGNRGIGLEICRQLAREGVKVILTARDEQRGMRARSQLEAEGIRALFHPLDTTDAAGIDRVLDYVESTFGRLDILVNNAGINIDGDRMAVDVDLGTLEKTLATNLYGPLRLSQAFLPLMRRRNYGRIVNVSSSMGSLAGMGAGYPAYRISKAALNAATRVLANELKGTNIRVNSVCPGWVRTDMGGEGADRSVEEGADTAVWLALLPDGGPTGGFFRDRKPIPW